MLRSSTSTSSEIIPLRGIKSEQFLVIAVSIAQDLGWNIQDINKAGLTAFTNERSTDRKVKIIVRIESFSAQLTCEPADEESRDPGESERVILDFTSAIYHRNHAYSAS